MDSMTKLAQNDGKASDGKKTVTNYTIPMTTPAQKQVQGKTPLKSRTCSDMETYKK